METLFKILIVLAILFIGNALWLLGRCKIDEVARALWAFLIVVIPILGAVAFFIVRPGRYE